MQKFLEFFREGLYTHSLNEEHAFIKCVSYASVSALLLSLSGRPWGSPYIAFFAFVPALLGLIKARHVLTGGLVTYIASLSMSLVGFEGLALRSPLAFFLVSAIESLWFILPGVITVILRKRLPVELSLLGFAVSWIAIETLSGSFVLWGNWAYPISIGLSQIDSFLLLAAQAGGIALVGFLVICFNVFVYTAIAKRRYLLFVPCFAIIVATALMYLEPSNANTGPNGLKVGMIQTATQYSDYIVANFNANAQAELINNYKALSKKVIEKHPDLSLLVWPENALGHYLDYFEELPASIEPIFPPDIPVIAGASSNGKNVVLFWNGKSSRIIYEKKVTVPIFESFVPKGRGQLGPLINISGFNIAVLVCWESLFPELSRTAVQEGADLLLYISDDEFGKGSVTPWYHMRATSLRAIESARPALFASQYGPSGSYDILGRRTNTFGEGISGYKMVEVSMPARELSTAHNLYGNWFGWLCIYITIALLSLRLPARAKKRRF